MRNLIDIVVDAKDGVIPTHEECYYAMLALSGKLHFVQKDLEAIAEAVETKEEKRILMTTRIRTAGGRAKVADSHFKFLKMEPTKWLGESGNPFSEQSKNFRDMGKKILEKAGVKLEDTNVPLSFVVWYSGMEIDKISKAYERFQKEKPN
jgi:hypothetical protein